MAVFPVPGVPANRMALPAILPKFYIFENIIFYKIKYSKFKSVSNF